MWRLSFCAAALVAPVSGNLFFSQYAEGSSNNKFMEIYNSGSASVSLDGYGFPRTTNGADTVGVYDCWNAFTAGASIAAGDVYVICHGSADAVILDSCDQTFSFMSTTSTRPERARAATLRFAC